MAVETLQPHDDLGVGRRWLRPTEFARASGISSGQVHRWLYAGRLRAKHVDRIWLIPVEELTEFFEREAA